jgi:integrase
MIGKLAEIIEAQRLLRKDLVPYVFHRDGERIKPFHHFWRKACKEAGVSGKLFHDFRRTAVRNLVRSGVPEKLAMEIAGHKTRAIFDRYNIINEDDIRDGLKKMQKYLSAQQKRTIHAHRKEINS